MPLEKACLICGQAKDDEVDLGVLYKKEDVTVHYFCMLLSSGLIQNTKVSDKKGILGFTLSDIKKEASRGNRLKCSFCKEKGSTIGCCVPSCRKTFHLPCGRQNGTMHHFFGDYRSYCAEHKVQQQLTPKKRGKDNCLICLSSIMSWSTSEALTSPCCIGTSFHRRCLQQYSISAGLHHFKCPKCNDKKQFQAEMEGFGIYLPDQDASWEKEPNAFQELYQQHSQCDAPSCVCPRGRGHEDDSGRYELHLCQHCGSFGSHKTCKGLIWKHSSLTCPECVKTLEEYDRKLRRKSRESLYNLGTPVRHVKRLSNYGTPANRNSQGSSDVIQVTESEAPNAKRPCLYPTVRDVDSTWDCFLPCLKINQHLQLANGIINVRDVPMNILNNKCNKCKHEDVTKTEAVISRSKEDVDDSCNHQDNLDSSVYFDTQEIIAVLKNVSDQFSPNDSDQISPSDSYKVSPIDSDQISPIDSDQISPSDSYKISPIDSDQISPSDSFKVSPIDCYKVSPIDSSQISPTDSVNVETSPLTAKDDNSVIISCKRKTFRNFKITTFFKDKTSRFVNKENNSLENAPIEH